MQVVVDGLLTHYEVQGKGKTVLLVHGWGDNGAGLQPVQSALARHCKVYAIDLPGFGGTEPPKTVWGLSEYADFLANFLNKVDEKTVFALVGHSNGGAIAIKGLASGTLSASKLVLLASAGVRGENKGRLKLIKYVTKAGKALTAPLPRSVKRSLRKQVYGAVGSDMLVAEHLEDTFKRVVAEDVRVEAAKLTQPTLLIYGEQDKATPVWYGEALHEAIDGSTLEILPGAGHFVHRDRADDVNKVVSEFLR
jgi:pimeloyl-ACP methyl ester carboxylesterase